LALLLEGEFQLGIWGLEAMMSGFQVNSQVYANSVEVVWIEYGTGQEQAVIALLD
jgi:hypothetical protein